MERALVVHAPMSDLGGAELVNLHVMKVLQESGYEITLLSDSWKTLPTLERFGLTIDNVEWKPLDLGNFIPTVPIASAYQRIGFLLLRQAKLRRMLRNEGGYDLIIDTFNGWDLPSGIGGRKIVYFHEIPLLNRPPGRLRNAYYALGEDIFRRHMTKIREAKALCNSTYTRRLLSVAYGIEGQLVYPPANVEFFSQVARNEPRENRFVVLARFCKEKKLQVAIEVLRKLIALVPDGKATIIGAVTSSCILEDLHQMSCLYHVDDHVTFEPDLDLESVREILSRSKVIFSTMPNEPFGTAIVEGMAAGCVPLVQKGGGQYEDIVKSDQFGLSYDDEDEAVHCMESIFRG